MQKTAIMVIDDILTGVRKHMKVVVIDGQGGGLGKQLVETIINSGLDVELTAVGTNSMATGAMLRAGAKKAATGENAVIVACRDADVIVGALGITIADSLLGEITPGMALAVGQSPAKKILIPMNMCDIMIAGVPKHTVAYFVKDALEIIKKLA